MKIAYIQNMRYPTEKAHGYQISKTCDALARSGAQVELFVTDRSTPIEKDPFEYYGIEKNFKLIRLQVLNLLGKFPKILSPLVMRVIMVTFFSSLKKTLQEEYNVFYTRDPWLAPKIKKLTNKPVYLELHAMPSERSIKKLATINGILCVTKWIENGVKKFLPNMRACFLPDSVDLEVFDTAISREQARQKLGITEQAKMIAYGGRFSTLEKGKGLDQLDRAVAEISKTVPDAVCYMVGGTKEEFEKIEGREPSATTNCIKSVDRPTLALYYRAADVLIMPFPNIHHYAFEMSPLKLFEYMASGTPIVTSDLPSVREIVDENSAYFFEAENSSALIASIKQTLNDESDAQTRADNAKQMVQAFTWQNRAKQIIDFVGSI